jgi:ribosomal protein S18 acetylase RimI-like enzyme
MTSRTAAAGAPGDAGALRRDECPAAAEVLAAAFRDNPLNRAVIGEPAARRLRANRAGSLASLEAALGRAWCRVARDAGRIRAVLIAEAPGVRPLPLPPLRTQLRALWGQGWRVAQRWSRVHFELDRLRPAEPHWYLDLLGVAPEAQARGHGGVLLAEWLARVDADGAPSYLETDRVEGRALYERAGYAVVGEERVLGARVWRMWRAARRTGSAVSACVVSAGGPGSEEGGNDVR